MLGAAPRGPGEHSTQLPDGCWDCWPGTASCRGHREATLPSGAGLQDEHRICTWHSPGRGEAAGLSQASLLGSSAHPWRWQRSLLARPASTTLKDGPSPRDSSPGNSILSVFHPFLSLPLSLTMCLLSP